MAFGCCQWPNDLDQCPLTAPLCHKSTRQIFASGYFIVKKSLTWKTYFKRWENIIQNLIEDSLSYYWRNRKWKVNSFKVDTKMYIHWLYLSLSITYSLKNSWGRSNITTIKNSLHWLESEQISTLLGICKHNFDVEDKWRNKERLLLEVNLLLKGFLGKKVFCKFLLLMLIIHW